MSWIYVDAIHEREVEKQLGLWHKDQARKRGENGPSWTIVTGGGNPLENTVGMLLPDAFIVDKIEGSGISFKRQ